MNGMIVTDSQRVVEITCDRDIEVPADGRTYHAADVIYFAALQNPAKYDDGIIGAGTKVNVKVLAIITELPENLQENEIDAVQDTES